MLPTLKNNNFRNNQSMKNFKIVILENPLTTWNLPKTRQIVNEIVSLKSEGYGRAFNDPLLVIPLDVFEFVGNHILLYKNDKLIMGYKNVSYHDCLRMNLDFPLNGPIRTGGTDEHKKAYHDFFLEHANKKISYDCHLTVSNETSTDPETLYESLSILHALAVHYRHTEEIDFTFMLGTYFAGTHKTFQKMGSVIFEGLPAIHLSTYDKREALIMLCNRSFSKKTLELAQKYEYLWKMREVISSTSTNELNVA
jgi:hypothetical protein